MRARPASDLEGVSLKPLLDDPDGTVKAAAFSPGSMEGRIFGRTIRTKRFRYIRWEGDGGGEELYDHTNDPREFTNLAARPEHSDTLQALRAKLEQGPPGARA